jgi:hypothetical protein
VIGRLGSGIVRPGAGTLSLGRIFGRRRGFGGDRCNTRERASETEWCSSATLGSGIDLASNGGVTTLGSDSGEEPVETFDAPESRSDGEEEKLRTLATMGLGLGAFGNGLRAGRSADDALWAAEEDW